MYAHCLPLRPSAWQFVRSAIQVSLLIFGLFVVGYSPVLAADLTVTNTSDSGAGSLRDTIAAASNGDTILFAASLANQTIVLTSEIDIEKNITITGNKQITLSGGNTNRILDIENGATVTIDGVTFTNGKHATLHGGAIFNSGKLTIINNTFIQNSAAQNGGAIFSDGTVTITDSTFTSNTAGLRGGAVDSNGTLTMSTSDVKNNNATNGGGIGNSGTMTVNTTLFTNNTAFTGGGIANSDDFTLNDSTLTENNANNGGGLYNSGEMTVERSTFVNNRSTDGGGASNTGTLDLRNTTFSANVATNFGGAVYNSVTLNLRNSTLTANEAASGAGLYSVSNATYPTHTLIVNQTSGDDCGGTISSNLYNIDSDGSCSLGSTGDLPSQTIVLSDLGDNGGETQTHLIESGSVAHNAGGTSCQTVDQRGITRAQDTNCDIGAHELVAPTLSILGNGVPLTPGDTTPDVADFTDFGNVGVGSQKITNFEIKNTGEADLTITAFDSTVPHFEAIGLPIVIPGNSTVALPISFSPNELVELLATLTITHNDPSQGPFVFTVVAQGVRSADGGSGASGSFGAHVEGSYWTTSQNGCWEAEGLSGCVYLNGQRVDHATGGNHYLDAAEITIRDNVVCLNVPPGYQASGYTLNQDQSRFVTGANCFHYDPDTDYSVYRVDFAIVANGAAAGTSGTGSVAGNGAGAFAAGNGASVQDAGRNAFSGQGAVATSTPTAVPPTATLDPTSTPTEVSAIRATQAAELAAATAAANPAQIAALRQQTEAASGALARAEALVIQTPTYAEAEEAAAIRARTRRYFWQDFALYTLMAGSVIALGMLGGMALRLSLEEQED